MSFDSTANLSAGKKAALIAIPAAVAVVTLAMIGGGASNTADKSATPALSSNLVVSSANAAEKAEPKAPAGAADLSDGQRSQVEKIIRSYLLKNPGILREMTAALQLKDRMERNARNSKIVISNKDSLYNSEHDYVYGNPKGNIGVVEYFDYNCAWCKRALNEVLKLADSDKNVRVVMKEFPIFGGDSQFAALAAMASKRQGKYWELHLALMKQKRVTKASVIDAAKKLGLDMAKLEKDMADPALKKAIQETARIAHELKIEGTPAFIVDTNVNVGFVPVAGLKSLIASARKSGCKASC